MNLDDYRGALKSLRTGRAWPRATEEDKALLLRLAVSVKELVEIKIELDFNRPVGHVHFVTQRIGKYGDWFVSYGPYDTKGDAAQAALELIAAVPLQRIYVRGIANVI